MEVMPTRMLKAGETVFKEGDSPDEGLCYICYGSVEISRREVDGSRTLATLEAGDVFGEMALINSAMRNATAMAKTDCGLFTVNMANFQHKVEQLDPVMRGVFRVFVLTIRDFLMQRELWLVDRKELLQQVDKAESKLAQIPEDGARKLLF